MASLSALLGRRMGVRGSTKRIIDATYARIRRAQLYFGEDKRYSPMEEGGVRYPAEDVEIQANTAADLGDIADAMALRAAVELAVDRANAETSADIVVDGEVLLTGVPAPTLILLEKMVTDLRTAVATAPVLDLGTVWEPDPLRSHRWVGEPRETLRLAKTTVYEMVAPATDRHPADVRERTEDRPVGTWTTTRRSSALRPIDQDGALRALDALRAAIKSARDEVNARTEGQIDEAEAVALFRWALAGLG